MAFNIENNYNDNREMTSREEWIALQRVNEMETHSIETLDPLEQMIKAIEQKEADEEW